MRTLVPKGIARPFDDWEILDQLRDPWSIILAESMSCYHVRAYIERERPLSSGVSVLVVRVAFGVILGTPAPIATRLTADEKALVRHIVCEGLTDAQIAVLLH